MTKRYLITGGAGFIGSNYIIHIITKYGKKIDVINLDKLTYAGNLSNLREVEDCKNYSFIQGDICDANLVNKIFTENKIDYVVNFAAESHVDRSIESAEDFVRTNVLGTQILLDAARNSWEYEGNYKPGVKFLQVSTDEVYGSLGDEGLFTEGTPLDPHSPYSASKAGADFLVKSYFDTHGLPINITRCSNNYGPFQYPEKLIPLIIKNCLLKKDIPVYGDGKNIRDWLYVEDHCRAIDVVIKNGKIGDIYNVGGNNERTNISIVNLVVEHIKNKADESVNDSLIKYVDDRKGHDRRYGIDSSKLSKEFNWEPMISFEEGIVKTIEWYLENRDFLGC
ncbi:dTDP-glucose 4,6-dehydratase [Methanomicrobiaceae archaeon CYW5]|uniref:dTDP-glucose 4,6-dehydratase n=1 Tax=Methanovulcanius yangii TaxID=1789227 RepID=UPI0029CA44B3|nr:dTDP-glucose 4,6-dehydratase [Methanovulcanius yangii]MBT8507868.1 dTDP-glucose 4,6-dehydratase [Methanovulcanius yangii]